jgi:ribonuclease HI
MLTIYTDGSSRGNPGPGGYGAVISYKKIVDSREEDWATEIGGREDHTTNNRMELTAVIKALEFVSKLQATSYQLETTINTDSEYVMKGITVWIHNWQEKNWRTANKKPVLNQDLWQELLRQTEGKQIEWKYVPGHTGVPLNERADEIATLFADNLTPDLYDGPRESYK